MLMVVTCTFISGHQVAMQLQLSSYCAFGKKAFYTDKMSSLKMNSDLLWLSCDHTFSSVSNVGSVRPDDGKWVKQYNGLFCVLNPEGQVLRWKLTRSLCFEHIEKQLQLLNERFRKNGQFVDKFYVDICCSWRQKLQNTFGPQLKVYLYLFHAVRRLGRKLPKCHPFHFACIRSLTLAFRDPTDVGLERKKKSPSPEIMCCNLEALKSKWE